MKIIYSASNAIEANLLKDILQQEGVDAHISGEYLQGGMGELPAMGLIHILVDDDDSDQAEKIISAWERGSFQLDSNQST